MRALSLAVSIGLAAGGAWSITAYGKLAAPAVHDVGIFSDLDPAVRITLPRQLDPHQTRLRVDDGHGLVLLLAGERPLKVYALTQACPAGPLPVSAVLARMQAGDAAELSATVTDTTAVERAPARPSPDDRDGDGIPDPLDVLMGARKLVLNGAAYTEGYVRIGFPGGDVPRQIGVCSDTIVRAYRNAGLDLQRLVADDIRAAPAAYPAISQPNASIDHRRVKTLLAWFRRHVPEVHDDRPLPGDVVFLDTFPSRPGPDHVGIISDRTAPSGQPFVINNWTVGYHEGEMDLLPAIPVTNRFRLK